MEQNQAHQPPRFTSLDVELAFRNNDTSQIETFIHEGLNLDEPMYNDKTPLQYSIIIENFEIANMLLKHGANPNAKIKLYCYNNETIYCSILWYSIEYCRNISQPRFVELLLSHGANPNSIEHNDQPMISKVIFYASSTILELLLKYGADPNTIVSDQDTILEQAVLMRHYDCAKILIKYGAKLTPPLIDLVRKRKEDGIFIAFLQKYSAYFENIKEKKINTVLRRGTR